MLQLAPGGHLGRFIVWTKSAFEKLDTVFGTTEEESGAKKGYTLPRSQMTNSDLTRLINSDEIQSVVRAPKVRTRPRCFYHPHDDMVLQLLQAFADRIACESCCLNRSLVSPGCSDWYHVSLCGDLWCVLGAAGPEQACATEEEPAEEPGRPAEAEPLRQGGSPQGAGPRGAAVPP